MRLRSLPRSGIEISELCFGSMRFVPPRSGSTDWGDGERAFYAAIDGGVNVVHSSSEYMTYEAIGHVLARHPKRSDLRHIVKVSSPDYDDGGFDASEFRDAVEQALRHLHTEQLTVVQHLQRGPNCPKEVAYSEEGDAFRLPALPEVVAPLFEIVEQLKTEGKIGEISTFPHTMGFLDAVLKRSDFDGVVHFYNLLETEMDQFLPSLNERRMSFIAIRPLLQGMLTDRRASRADLPGDDPKRGANWDPWYALLEEIKEVIGGPPTSWTDYALRFSLAHPGVTSVVPSMNTVDQVEDALGSAGRPQLPRAEVRAVSEVGGRFGLIPKETLFG